MSIKLKPEPANMIIVQKFRLIAISIFFISLSLCAFAQSSRSVSLTKNLVEAMNSQDSERIISLLDDSCQIANLPRGMNDKVIPLIFKKFAKIVDYKIIKEENEHTGLKVSLAVTYDNGKPGKPNFIFAADGKVLNLNIISIKKQPTSDNLPQAPLKGILPNEVLLPFKITNNLIYVATKINGKAGWLHFDSGAAFTILNQADFPSNDKQALTTTVTGINGASTLTHYTVDSLELGDMKISDFTTLTAPDAGGAGSFGLIGYDIFKDYEITINYKSNLIAMHKIDSAGNYVNSKLQTKKPILVASILVQRHIPILKLSVNGKEFNMGLDCGANSNLFFMNNYPLLKNVIQNETETEMNGLGEKSVMVKSGLMKKALVGKLPFYNMLTVFSDNNMGNANSADKLAIDGILGYPFLRQYIISINSRKQEVRFY